jgi:hypothetical protein
MAFSFITICEGLEIPTSSTKLFEANTQVNVTYALTSNPTNMPIKFTVKIQLQGGDVSTLIPLRDVPNEGTDMCNELKGLIINVNSVLYVQASASGLYFRANGFTFS